MDGSLQQQTAHELEALRGKRFSLRNRRVDPKSSDLLRDVEGAALEMYAKFRRGDSTRVGTAAAPLCGPARSDASLLRLDLSTRCSPPEVTDARECLERDVS